VERFDSSGVHTVHSRHPRWEEAGFWTVAREPSVSVGGLNGPIEEILEEVSAARRQRDGDLVVADRQGRAVRVYDGQGSFVKSLGRPGAGPGEFQSPAEVVLAPGDSILVWDEQLFRLSLFDEGGKPLGDRTLDMGVVARKVDPPLYPGVVRPLPEGGFLVRLVDKGGGKGTVAGLSRRRSGALWVAEDQTSVKTIALFPGEEVVGVEAPWGFLDLEPPLAKRSPMAWSLHSRRICIGTQEGFAIDCYEENGERNRISWDYDPPPVTRGEVEGWRTETTRLLDPKVGPEELKRMLDGVLLPERRPPHGPIYFDAGGNLWVEAGLRESREGIHLECLVFDPDGAWLGIVSLPPLRILEIGSDYVLGVYQDDLEVQYLHLYELRKPDAH
jgi:hypothetical protein